MDNQPFHYKLDGASSSTASPVVLLHGSGRTEDDLLLYGREAFPGHKLFLPRGNVAWENGFAFFRRHPDRTLDIEDVRDQATRLCDFLEFVARRTGQRPFVAGYSNGAIVAAETIFQKPELSRGAILLRPLSPRSGEPFPPLHGYPALLLAGMRDDRRHPEDAPFLADQLTKAGAAVSLKTLPGGHGWADDAADVRHSQDWLSCQ